MMTRMQRKAVIRKTTVGKTPIRKQYSMGVGVWDATLKDAKAGETKNGKSIVKLIFADNNSNREGIYMIPLVGKIMDSMIDNVFGDGEEDIYLEDLIGYKFKIQIERNGDFLNIVYIELIDEENEEDNEYEEENLEDEIFKENSHYIEEDDYDFDLDDDFDVDDEDLPSSRLGNGGRR